MKKMFSILSSVILFLNYSTNTLMCNAIAIESNKVSIYDKTDEYITIDYGTSRGRDFRYLTVGKNNTYYWKAVETNIFAVEISCYENDFDVHSISENAEIISKDKHYSIVSSDKEYYPFFMPDTELLSKKDNIVLISGASLDEINSCKDVTVVYSVEDIRLIEPWTNEGPDGFYYIKVYAEKNADIYDELKVLENVDSVTVNEKSTDLQDLYTLRYTKRIEISDLYDTISEITKIGSVDSVDPSLIKNGIVPPPTDAFLYKIKGVNDIIYGDMNNDNKVDLTDLSSLSLVLLNDSSLDETNQLLADIDGDGNITVADLARLKQYVSNQITSLR